MTPTRRLWLLAAIGALAPAARAQQPRRRTVALLHIASRQEATNDGAVLREQLRELGQDVGPGVVVEARWADNDLERLPVLARELASKAPDVFVVLGTAALRAAMAASPDTPVVTVTQADLVRLGFAHSLARPGGNVTGVLGQGRKFGMKWLELASELKPGLKRVGWLRNANNPPVDFAEYRARSAQRGVAFQVVETARAEGIAAALDTLAAAGTEVVLLPYDPMILTAMPSIVERTTARRIACVGPPEVARSGGAVGYGTNLAGMFRTAARQVDKLLRGARAGDLPIEQTTKDLLVVNLRSVRALGLQAPHSLLAWADEVIE